MLNSSLMQHGLITLFLGFVIGISHAFEPDHVVAISTIVSRQKNAFKAAFIGTIWGLGHTTMLFIIGILVVLFKISIPERINMFMNLVVGGMLLFLGFRLLFKTKAEIRENNYFSKRKEHSHHHIFFIGLLHGMAGTAALMLLILSTISSFSQAIWYIILFGVGSIIGMMIMTFLLSLPLQLSIKKFPKIEYYIYVVAATISILFGLFVIYKLVLIEGFFFPQQ